ncbi:hypothetical protein FIBSPDRAFT_982105 [Athelia psychrophila]|uniref:F-box domain-containing protein n=1 Tax=Athelia psychrophila TaxID=1759441 RepID=A0A166T6K6_9AGAM|nr:hypothetical protein FIBSPDRAFT_982105 [Fibularhizoctonia sp. CBS 109695]
MALPSLTQLELQECYVQVDLPRPPVVLPALQALHASSSYMYGFLDFLGPCLHVASLTVLTLQGGNPIEQVPEVHFPSLRHLILLEVTKAVPGFSILSQFPSIQRLTCRAAARHNQSFQIGIADVLAALGPDPHEDGDTGHRIPCPQLHTVAVSTAYKPLDVLAVTAQISTLRENGIPIRKLLLPESSLTQSSDGSEAIAEFRTFVEIEDFQIDWPTPFANVQFTDEVGLRKSHRSSNNY